MDGSSIFICTNRFFKNIYIYVTYKYDIFVVEHPWLVRVFRGINLPVGVNSNCRAYGYLYDVTGIYKAMYIVSVNKSTIYYLFIAKIEFSC